MDEVCDHFPNIQFGDYNITDLGDTGETTLFCCSRFRLEGELPVYNEEATRLGLRVIIVEAQAEVRRRWLWTITHRHLRWPCWVRHVTFPTPPFRLRTSSKDVYWPQVSYEFRGDHYGGAATSANVTSYEFKTLSSSLQRRDVSFKKTYLLCPQFLFSRNLDHRGCALVRSCVHCGTGLRNILTIS